MTQAIGLKVFCGGSDRTPHPRGQVARLAAWIDDAGARFIQDNTKLPDGSKRAETLRLTGERVRRRTPIGDGLMYRAPDGREHVVRPPTPSGLMGTAISERHSVTWVFTCPRCQDLNPQDHHQMSNRRVFKAVFTAIDAGQLKPTIADLEFWARQQG